MESYFCFEPLVDTVTRPCGIHHHDFYEVYYLIKGVCWSFVGEKSYRLTAGDIVLIPPGVIHKTNYETATYTRMLFHASEDYIPQSVRALIPRLPYLSYSPGTEQRVKALFEDIRRETVRQDEYSADIVRNKVAALLLLIARESRSQQKKQESPLVERAAQYIREHYADTVTLNDVAKYCYVSREHLSRVFKKETGFGFNAYLNVYRLKKANTMLTEDKTCKISQVALSCGFNDSNYFSKIYKKAYGIAPGHSRKGL